MVTKATKSKKKTKKNIPSGIAHINSTFNNTIITITDTTGNTISWSSSGNKGFKGSRKSTPFAAQLAAEEAGKKAMEHGMKHVEVVIKGPGNGRESAIRASGINWIKYNRYKRYNTNSTQWLSTFKKKKSIELILKREVIRDK